MCGRWSMEQVNKIVGGQRDCCLPILDAHFASCAVHVLLEGIIDARCVGMGHMEHPEACAFVDRNAIRPELQTVLSQIAAERGVSVRRWLEGQYGEPASPRI